MLGKGTLPCWKTVAIHGLLTNPPKILAVYPMGQHSKFKSPSIRSYPMTSNQRAPTSDVPWNPQSSAFKPSSKSTLNKIVPVRLLENFTHILIMSCHVTSGSLMLIRSLLNTIRQYNSNISTLSCLSARVVRLFLTYPDLHFILLSCLYTRTYYRIYINGYRNIVYDAITHRSNATRGIYICNKSRRSMLPKRNEKRRDLTRQCKKSHSIQTVII